MNDRQNRTIICSVLFLDIVEYSHQPVAEQIRLRNRFNALLVDALQSVATNDRIILDTGDGAAVSFTGDPEDALFMALTLRDAIAAEPATAVPALKLRFGINLGPVKLVKDLNGHPNLLGDGINVAQRVMSFSAPGQILVSRSYYEVVSRLSDEYFRLFHYEGPRTDKHVREHEVYAVDAERPSLQRPITNQASRRGAASGGVFYQIARNAVALMRNLYRKPALAAALAVIVVLAVTLAVRINREPPDKTETKAQGVAAPAVAAPAEKTAPVVEKVQTAAAKSAAKPEDKSAAAPKTAPAAPPAPIAAPAAPSTPTAPAAQAPPAAPAQAAPATQVALAAPVPAMNKAISGEATVVSVAVSPWGEVYVDDKKQGVSPPLHTIQVTPGRHKIEIKNTTFPSHVETINVKPGSQITIRHRFVETD